MNIPEASLFVVPIGIGSTLILAASAFREDGQFSFFTDNNSRNREIALVLLISFCYFFLDFFLMIKRYRPDYKIYFIHHIIGILSVPIVYFAAYPFVKYLLGYLMYEVSTIFLNMSKICRKQKINNLFSRSANLLFVFTYVILRIFFGTFMTFDLMRFVVYQEYPPTLKSVIVLPIVLQLLNYWWFYRIILMMKRNSA